MKTVIDAIQAGKETSNQNQTSNQNAHAREYCQQDHMAQNHIKDMLLDQRLRGIETQMMQNMCIQTAITTQIAIQAKQHPPVLPHICTGQWPIQPGIAQRGTPSNMHTAYMNQYTSMPNLHSGMNRTYDPQTYMNPHYGTPIYMNHYNGASTYMNQLHGTPEYVNHYNGTPAYMNQQYNQPYGTPTYVNQHHAMPTYMNLHYRTPTNVNQQQMPGINTHSTPVINQHIHQGTRPHGMPNDLNYNVHTNQPNVQRRNDSTQMLNPQNIQQHTKPGLLPHPKSNCRNIKARINHADDIPIVTSQSHHSLANSEIQNVKDQQSTGIQNDSHRSKENSIIEGRTTRRSDSYTNIENVERITRQKENIAKNTNRACRESISKIPTNSSNKENNSEMQNFRMLAQENRPPDQTQTIINKREIIHQ
ncbi:unnamed protein product [Mytilus edulis]|uniref:Uncharacterized protein n=1 Tax=Mytilus edulis TaxID=6550 RepID=A0A8S3T3I6_MYTED|nr:unnamed protein product [Mytilus edulis]